MDKFFAILIMLILLAPACQQKMKPVQFKLLKGKTTKILLSKTKVLSITYHGISGTNLVFHDGKKEIKHDTKITEITLSGHKFYTYTFSDFEIVIETYIQKTQPTRGMRHR